LLVRFESIPILNLDNMAIQSLVGNAFSVQNGVATLGTINLFSASYLVDSAITYSDEMTVVADFTPTPEPSAIVLLATGAVAFFRVARPHASA
jgi:hypothetical protein